VFLNQRGAEFSFSTPSAPPRPIHSNLSGADFQFAGFGRQMGFPPMRGSSNADVYLTGKQSRSFANSTGPEYRFLISDRV